MFVFSSVLRIFFLVFLIHIVTSSKMLKHCLIHSSQTNTLECQIILRVSWTHSKQIDLSARTPNLSLLPWLPWATVPLTIMNLSFFHEYFHLSYLSFTSFKNISILKFCYFFHLFFHDFTPLFSRCTKTTWKWKKMERSNKEIPCCFSGNWT